MHHYKCKDRFKKNLHISHRKEIEKLHIRKSEKFDENFNFLINGRNSNEWIEDLEDIFHFFILNREAKLKLL